MNGETEMTAPVADPWVGTDAVPTEKPQPHARPLENRAETYSLETLQSERRQKIKRYAELAAKFKGGQNASAETKRKEHRMIIATDILNTMRVEWAKNHTEKEPFKEPAEAALERMARADQRHRTFNESLEKEYVEYILLENEITEINEKIASRRTELECYKAELFLSGGG
jgi:chromosome segregation ATPase